MYLIHVLIIILGPKKIAAFDSKIQHLIEMGIEETKACEALSYQNWNLERAIDELFS